MFVASAYWLRRAILGENEEMDEAQPKGTGTMGIIVATGITTLVLLVLLWLLKHGKLSRRAAVVWFSLLIGCYVGVSQIIEGRDASFFAGFFGGACIAALVGWLVIGRLP
jgi:hypothetical protein